MLGDASAGAGADAGFCNEAGGAVGLAGSGSGAEKSSKSACDADAAGSSDAASAGGEAVASCDAGASDAASMPTKFWCKTAGLCYCEAMHTRQAEMANAQAVRANGCRGRRVHHGSRVARQGDAEQQKLQVCECTVW